MRVNETIQDTLELISYPLRADGVEVGLSLAPELPPLWADRHQLQQVLINLLTNAHHALREVPAPRRLSVTARLDAGAGRIVIEVADSGPGMTPALSRRIFEPFFTTKPEGHGTGLGLSLCRGIVESHGGALSVESEPGRGATFRVALPVGAPERESEARAPAADAAGRSLSVLVVDDERGVRELIAELLQRDGHKVQVAADGAAALERLAAGAFDLVLSDIRMPRLDGLALYREAARRHPGMGRRFVFVTGDTLTPDTREFLQRSRAPQLAKPFDAEQLRSVLGHALARAAGSDAEDEEPGGVGKEGR